MPTKKIQILDSLNKNAVLYTPQELTAEEKKQARDNIGSASLDENGKVPFSQLPEYQEIEALSKADLEEILRNL